MSRRDLGEAALAGNKLVFKITTEHTDPATAVSAEAIEAAGEQIVAWIAACVIVQWGRVGVGPKTVAVQVKVMAS